MIRISNRATCPETNRQAVVYIASQWTNSLLPLEGATLGYFNQEASNANDKLIWLFDPVKTVAVYITASSVSEATLLEKCRRAGDLAQKKAKDDKTVSIVLRSEPGLAQATLAFAEGMMLGAYQFAPYKSNLPGSPHPLEEIVVENTQVSPLQTETLLNTMKAVYLCRDLVNTPANFLNTTRLAAIITEEANQAGIAVEVLDRKQIESLKMGGLLAVNKGSVDPPVFITMDYHPENAVNPDPLVLVGKGVTFDTGGMNLKTGTYMDNMKLDMGGAAAVASALLAIALNKLPIRVVVLIPATDNRTDGNALLPGDVITMFDGTTVEVLNTDAEGRLILADALAWAKRYNPMLVVDAATLTGAAARAIGNLGIVAMHQSAEHYMQLVKTAGETTGERIAEFPFWEAYDEQIKSDIADLKNIGGPEAGAITAGKFLAHFTSYPYIHLDIAGPVFLDKRDSYRGAGATGVAVRLLAELARTLSVPPATRS